MNPDYKGSWIFTGIFAGFLLLAYVSILFVEYFPDREITKEQYAELESIRMYSVSVVPEYRPAVSLIRSSFLDGKISRREFRQIKKLANAGFKQMVHRQLEEAKVDLIKRLLVERE